MDSQSQLYHNEESKISSPMPAKTHIFNSRGSQPPSEILSPDHTKDKSSGISQTSRNLTINNMKKSQARHLSPLSNDPVLPGGASIMS